MLVIKSLINARYDLLLAPPIASVLDVVSENSCWRLRVLSELFTHGIFEAASEYKHWVLTWTELRTENFNWSPCMCLSLVLRCCRHWTWPWRRIGAPSCPRCHCCSPSTTTSSPRPSRISSTSTRRRRTSRESILLWRPPSLVLWCTLEENLHPWDKYVALRKICT